MTATAKNMTSVAQHGMLFIFAASSSINFLFSERIAAFELEFIGFLFFYANIENENEK
jgi:tRNA(His) 5'-end guanylyltransferase